MHRNFSFPRPASSLIIPGVRQRFVRKRRPQITLSPNTLGRQGRGTWRFPLAAPAVASARQSAAKRDEGRGETLPRLGGR